MVLQFMAFFAAAALVFAGAAMVWAPLLWVSGFAALGFVVAPVIFCAWMLINITET